MTLLQGAVMWSQRRWQGVKGSVLPEVMSLLLNIMYVGASFCQSEVKAPLWIITVYLYILKSECYILSKKGANFMFL